jgi:hypothetical protein
MSETPQFRHGRHDTIACAPNCVVLSVVLSGLTVIRSGPQLVGNFRPVAIIRATDFDIYNAASALIQGASLIKGSVGCSLSLNEITEPPLPVGMVSSLYRQEQQI